MSEYSPNHPAVWRLKAGYPGKLSKDGTWQYAWDTAEDAHLRGNEHMAGTEQGLCCDRLFGQSQAGSEAGVALQRLYQWG